MKNVNFCEIGFGSTLSEESEEIFDDIFKIRKKLLKNMLKREKLLSHHRRILTPLQYYKEFGSLYLDFNRQSGSTFFHHWFLNWCTEKKYQTISLFHHIDSLRHFINQHKCIERKTREDIDNHFLGTYKNKYSTEKLREISDIDFIVLDVSGIYKTHQINLLINEMTEYKPKLFIFL